MFAIGSVIAIASCVSDDRTAASGQAIVGGTPDGNDAATVLLGGGGGWCTGTLVSPNVVLTAGHCVYDSPSGFAYFGSSYPGSGTISLVKTHYAHPDFSPQDFRNADVGVAVLASPVAVPPIALDRTDLVGSVGANLHVVGFGETLSSEPSFSKMEKDTAITSVLTKEITIGPAICGGDSGGPGLLTLPSGDVVVAGVISWYTLGCHGQGGLARVDVFADWIQMQIDAAATSGGSDAGVTADAGPSTDAEEPGEPGGMKAGGCQVGAEPSILVAAIVASGLRRRKRPRRDVRDLSRVTAAARRGPSRRGPRRCPCPS